MEIIKDTRLEVAPFAARLFEPGPSLVVVVKGTFNLVGGGTAPLSEVQSLPGVEVHHEGEAEVQSVRHDSDVALYKPHAECLLAGTAHAPRGRPVGVLPVLFQVGPVSKRLAVIGDREWKRGLLGRTSSEPLPFASMPLVLERAFGGKGFGPNPLGVGHEPSDARWALPNLEDPAHLIDSPRARPDPACFAPIPRMFASRLRLAGTFDEQWKATRWPGLPEDFDFAYFNAAPIDQRIEGWFRGDEEIVLENLHPDHARLATRLPGLTPRCFLDDREVTLVLDTITVDADLGRIFCLWRGHAEVEDEHLASVGYLHLVDERPGETTAAAAYRARLAERTAADAIAPVAPPAALSLPIFPAEDAARLRSEVQARLAAKESLAGRDLTGADLSGLRLAAVDLTSAILTGARLERAVLTGARLDRAVLAGARAAGADLSSASLVNADLTRIEAGGARFDGADLSGALLEEGGFGSATFCKASCVKTEMTKADLSRADFSGADLSEADLAGARLDGGVFEGATLTEAGLEETSALGARFAGADLSRAKGRAGRFAGASFTGVVAEAARFREANLDGADLSGARLSSIDLSGASLAGATLVGCALRGARFTGARLTGAKLCGSDLFEASFEAADLTRADLSGSSCFGAELWKAKVESTVLDGADLDRTKLAGSR